MNTLNRFLTALLLASLATWTQADDIGIFFGGNVGYAELDQDTGDFVTAMTNAGFNGTADIDDSGFGWKAFIGYNFARHFGLEAGYVDLGEVDGDFALTVPAAGTGKVDVEVSGYTLTAIGRYPLYDRFEMFGKLGGLFWDKDGRATFIAGATSATTSADDDGMDLTVGIGMKYDFSEHIGLRVEWDRYFGVGDDSANADMFSAGLEFNY